jgi:hypothetical protein
VEGRDAELLAAGSYRTVSMCIALCVGYFDYAPTSWAANMAA